MRNPDERERIGSPEALARALQKGLDEFDRGEGIPAEEAEPLLRDWIDDLDDAGIEALRQKVREGLRGPSMDGEEAFARLRAMRWNKPG